MSLCIVTALTVVISSSLGLITSSKTSTTEAQLEILGRGNRTKYLYDRARNLVAKRDANGNLVTLEYDELNQPTKEHVHLDAHALPTRQTLPLQEPLDLSTNSGTLTWETTYDENGNVRTLKDPKGQLRTDEHGILNRKTSETWSNHATPREYPSLESLTYVRDNNGNIKTETAVKRTSATATETQTTSREYDALDRLKKQTSYDNKVIQYGYDKKGNRTSVSELESGTTSYTYDALDRLKTMTINNHLTTFGYELNGLPRSKYTQSNGRAFGKK